MPSWMILDIALFALVAWVIAGCVAGGRVGQWMIGGLVIAAGIGLMLFFAVAIGTFVIFHPAAWAFIGFIVLVGPPCDWLLGGSGRL